MQDRGWGRRGPAAAAAAPRSDTVTLLGATSAAGRCWMVAFVAVMVAVPTIGLLRAERPAPLSWHMYSGPPRVEAFEVERDGRLETVDLEQWVVKRRAEARSLAGLPEHICDVDGAVEAVWVERQDMVAQDRTRERRPCAR